MTAVSTHPLVRPKFEKDLKASLNARLDELEQEHRQIMDAVKVLKPELKSARKARRTPVRKPLSGVPR